MNKEAAAWGIFDRVLDACAALACAMLLFQVVSVSADVLLRYFWDISYSWITALNEWSLVYIAFLGAGWLEREGGHTRDESMVKFFGPPGERLAERLGQVFGIAICLLLVWFGADVTWDKYQKGVYDFFKLQAVPVFWIYLAIPVGAALWLVQLLRQMRGRHAAVVQPLPPEF
jgi:TRAP-type C4-dicarboxylate transport system permease small subunit